MYKKFSAPFLLFLFTIYPNKGWTGEWVTNTPESIPTTYGTVWNGPDENIEDGLWLVNFWATWCAPCIKELPDLQAAAKSLSPRISVALVNVGETPEQIIAYANENPQLGLADGAPVFQGMDFRGMQDWQLRGLPTTVLVRNGQRVAHFEGVKPWHEAEEIKEIQRLLNAE